MVALADPAGAVEEVLRVVAQDQVGLGREPAPAVLGGCRGARAVLQLPELLLALDDLLGQFDDFGGLFVRLLLGGVVLVGGAARGAVELVELLADGFEVLAGREAGPVLGVGEGVGFANAVPGAASTVTAQTTASAVAIRPRLPVPIPQPPTD